MNRPPHPDMRYEVKIDGVPHCTVFATSMLQAWTVVIAAVPVGAIEITGLMHIVYGRRESGVLYHSER